jgi:hypothetical protein
MKSILGFALIGVLLFSSFVSYLSNYQYYKATPGPLGVLSVFILWIWMVIDFFRRKGLPHKIRWGISLLVFNWIASIIYFVVVFQQNQNKIGFFENIKLKNPTFYRYFILVILSSVITICHFSFFTMVYGTFGIPFQEFYTVVVDGIVYAPMSLFLEAVYRLAGVDFVSPPKEVAIFTHVVSFIYTFLLYLLLIMVLSHFRKSRASYKETTTA